MSLFVASDSSAAIETVRAGRREWIGLAVLTLPAMLLAMDLTLLYLAVPALSADLSPSGSQLLWITDIYGFLIAGSLITMGTLGDRIGRRRLLLIGAAGFALASILAAFSTSAEMLIATRALLGVTGATLMPSTLSLIRNMFHDPSERTTAIGIWATSFSVGGVIGPLMGGLLLQYFWWGSVFLLGVPVMVLLLVIGPLLLPEYRDPTARRFDLVSAALSLVAVLAIIYGIKRLAAGDGLMWPGLSVCVGLAIGTLFVRRQNILADPLVDLRLFDKPAFSVSVVVNTFMLFAWAGSFLLVAQYLQLVLGLSALEAGLWTLPGMVTSMVGCLIAPPPCAPLACRARGVLRRDRQHDRLCDDVRAECDSRRGDGRDSNGRHLRRNFRDDDIDHRSDRVVRAARARRRRLGHLGNRRRTRPCAGRRRAGEHRRCCLSSQYRCCHSCVPAG